MVFSSVVFLVIFLVMVLGLYYLPFIHSRNYKNVILLLASLFFYAWGERVAVFLLIASIIVNYLFGIIIDKKDNKIQKRIWRDVAVFFNILILFVFKYLSFIMSNIGLLIGIDLKVNIALPIGISFYTFQIISYIIDLYNGKVEVQKNPVHLGLYVSFFPQLIAGPIVRYKTVEEEINGRKENFADFKRGFFRFVKGLSKKVLIANNIAYLVDLTFSFDELSIVTAWLGAIAYTLQIYFDFSGYSDMAIGLGRMFGFHFDENFNHPYVAKSVTDFWRRWHISLSLWFRDYVYIPLGGNREGRRKTYRNLFIVWLLTGIWHGANWTYLVWGMGYFLVLMIEKNIDLSKIPALIGHLYTKLTIILGWVMFKASSVRKGISYIGKMFGIRANGFCDKSAIKYLGIYKWFIIIGITVCLPVKKWITNAIMVKCDNGEAIVDILRAVAALMLFMLCIIYVVSSDYNPFIYYNF